MTPEELMADLIVKHRMPWAVAERLIRAGAYLREGVCYLKYFPLPCSGHLPWRREGESQFDYLTR